MRHNQTIAHNAHCGLCLVMSVLSPYFQMTGPVRKIDVTRDRNYPNKNMKALIYDIVFNNSLDRISPLVKFYDEINDLLVEDNNVDITFSGLNLVSDQTFTDDIKSAIISYNPTYGLTVTDVYGTMPRPVGTASRSFANPSRTLNSAFQISTTRDAMAFYSVSIPTALSLTGGENGAVVLEYADDSGISTNVVTVGTVRNGNTGTLTLGLNTLASMGCQIAGMIPAGKYVRLRPVDTTGSPVQAFVSAQEVLI